MRLRKNMSGITLIELMIVVVIAAMLAMVAYPNYREFAARAKRNEARAALLQAATNQERFYLQNQAFTTDLTQLGFAVDNPADPTSATTDTGSYVISVVAPNPAANFTVTATYQFGGGESTKCNTFTINGAGVRTSGPDADCWTRTR